MNDAFDLIVLGAGSGGLAAAKRAASHGARVAIVEGDRVGGTCVIRGCVPKKLLVYGSRYAQLLADAPSYGWSLGEARPHPGRLLAAVRAEVSRLQALHTGFLEKAGVALVRGWGRFHDAHSVAVRDAGGAERVLRGERILIAVGGRPQRPAIPGADLAWVSDDLFELDSLPASMVVVGAGYIACEFAGILQGLGVSVTQLVRRERLLRAFDREAALAVQEAMAAAGIRLRFGCSPAVISGDCGPGDLVVTSTDGERFDCGGVLLATGRQPFLEGLALEAAGVLVENGRIPVDAEQRTNVAHIHAVGDVTDRICLTPVAIEEGRAFADSVYGQRPRQVDHSLVASAVFSQPELATVGLSEEEAIARHGAAAIHVHRARFRPMSQALPARDPKVLLKLIVAAADGRVLGCHMVGEHAAEIIQMAAIALGMGATKADFDRTMALHPSLAEEFVTLPD
ncbi:MAG: glutathione-disulfide reductase [Synechococcaceae cyanobacterium]|nr:glutathione-disulfide reductase [Synechococcaceae cyanobacterium]